MPQAVTTTLASWLMQIKNNVMLTSAAESATDTIEPDLREADLVQTW